MCIHPILKQNEIPGLPLNLAVNGTSAVQLKSKTNFDVGNMLTTGDALLEAKIYPTATVQVTLRGCYNIGFFV